MEKYNRFILSCCLAMAVSGCVTQTYENDNATPVVQNESSNNEIAMTRISLGLGYLKMGNTTQAKLNLEKAKRYAPKLVQVHTAFAHYYDSVGEPEQATAAYEQALSLKSDDADTLNNYGVFLCKQGKYAAAEKQILKAIAVPSYLLVSQSYENLALCQLKANHFDEAELYLEKAILHSPSDASSLLNMVKLQYAKGAYKSAENHLHRYEKATRRFSPDSLALAYKVFAQQNKLKMAKNYAAMLVKMFPHSYQAKQYLLNGLREIEADRIAKQYYLAKQNSKPKKQKRTLKLSPKTQSTAPKLESQVNKPVVKMEKPEVKSASQTVDKVIVEKTTQTDAKVSVPVHVVSKGDSLYSISKKYNIHMKAIERWNGIKRSDLIKIGDVIYLANPKKVAKS
ncbi:hypothetical protein tinsulaeT_27310 [Thalassotalea insulae]|uniref:LysM domain-containing protein n=1 Tax=Thalassotalea insulae TaxID=2056778 RepID=A0ABQ6GTX0_9GAMM|nr:type IV pilus biogenesis/stability protein PilW [Thalassotalea insulae]GLX79391.1 hypothetical protein tinsulaeT_27310 [Thalassotalea insulae]